MNLASFFFFFFPKTPQSLILFCCKVTATEAAFITMGSKLLFYLGSKLYWVLLRWLPAGTASQVTVLHSYTANPASSQLSFLLKPVDFHYLL